MINDQPFELWRKLEYSDDNVWEKVTIKKVLDCCSEDQLKHYRAVINGKLGKRKISAEQQAKMQAARKLKVI